MAKKSVSKNEDGFFDTFPELGDIVRLRSGGPDMVVRETIEDEDGSLGGDKVNCVYFNAIDGTFYEKKFMVWEVGVVKILSKL